MTKRKHSFDPIDLIMWGCVVYILAAGVSVCWLIYHGGRIFLRALQSEEPWALGIIIVAMILVALICVREKR